MLIKVIFTGGTIGSRGDGDTVSLADKPPYELLQGDFAGTEFKVCEPYHILSEELSARELCALARCVGEQAADCDGIIVTHGTDSLVYTAAFLSFIFGASLPLAIVSSGYPLPDPRSNGRENFAAAVSFIASGRRGVAVPWSHGGKTEIHCGSRLLRQLPYDDMLVSLGGERSVLRDGEFCGSWDIPARERTDCPDERSLAAGFGGILRFSALPSMRYPDLGGGVRAIIIDCYHSGTLCADARFAEFARQANALGIPIFAAGTGGREQEYETVGKFVRLGVLPLPCSSPEAMYVKLALGIAFGLGGSRLGEFMAKQIAGEIVVDSGKKSRAV